MQCVEHLRDAVLALVQLMRQALADGQLV